MDDACLFNIMELSSEDLQRVLPKASTRALARLTIAYPRAVGRPFLDAMSQCLSPMTLEFVKEELSMARRPSWSQIQQAENELMKIIIEEKLLPSAVAV